MSKEDKKIIEMIKEDNHNMRQAGCELAMAAIWVVKDYDGTHRLMIAVSKWCEAISNEGKRKNLKQY